MIHFSKKPLAAFVLMACSASACTTIQAGGHDDLCTMDVTDANAWINRMPTVGERAGATLNVLVRVQPADRIRALMPVEEAGPVLRLKVAEGQPPLQPGTLSWRMYAPEPPFEAVEISCNGDMIARIDDIDTVY